MSKVELYGKMWRDRRGEDDAVATKYNRNMSMQQNEAIPFSIWPLKYCSRYGRKQVFFNLEALFLLPLLCHGKGADCLGCAVFYAN